VEEDRRGVFAGNELDARIQVLLSHAALGPAIVSFWLAGEHRQARTWPEHRDINDVMLATSLIPDGFLALSRPPAAPTAYWMSPPAKLIALRMPNVLERFSLDRVLNSLFINGDPLPAPYPACGADPTADTLACSRTGC
jgi:hypothetical protein